MRRWSVAFLWFAVAACSEPAPTSVTDTQTTSDSRDLDVASENDASSLEGLAWDLVDTGPYRVGYRTLTFSYDAVDHDEPRDIKLSIWYPTEDSDGVAASYLGLLDDELSFQDASLAPSVYGDTYPVHIHSHGHQGFAGSTNFMMRHFASHGWVVAAPDHTGNTLVDNLDPRPPWMYTVRPADISAALDQLENLPEGDPLKDVLATDRVVMSGHSFGGYTAFVSAGASFNSEKVEQLCSDDPCADETIQAFSDGVREPRVIASIPMAAGNRDMFGDAGYATLECPVLYMTGSLDHPGVNEAVWESLEGTDSIRIDVAGGCHQLFGLGACHEIADEEGFGLVQGYALAFARHHVLGDTSVLDLLEGTASLSDKILYLSHQTPE